MHRFLAHPARILAVLLGTVVLVGAVALALPAGSHDAPAVYAAASLRKVLPQLDGAPAYNFAGSDTLQLQVERGAPADVFAAASSKQPQALHAEGRCEQPVTFATNRLVLVVPAAARAGEADSLAALQRGGHRLAVGTAGVPVGDYTRKLLAATGHQAILARNTVSQEKDVAGVLSKVALGSADAGFVYHTDALAARGRVREIALPGTAGAPVTYQLCVVRRDGADRDGARDFVAHVTGADGRRALAAAGFGLPR
jgi:molybdate transport system substrate-binding protein